MELDLTVLNYDFLYKPLLVGGKAMEYYNLRKAGNDIDLIVQKEDHKILKNKFPNNIKDLYGDIGICEYGFEIWNQICTFGYYDLKEDGIEEDNYIVISLEKLLFLKSLGMEIPKYHKDLEMIVKKVLGNAYKNYKHGKQISITYDKLVRDNVIDILKTQGKKGTYKILDEQEYIKELNKKLLEEAKEFIENNDVEELADIFEVIYKIMELKNIKMENIEEIRKHKIEERGGFEKRIFLKNVIENES